MFFEAVLINYNFVIKNILKKDYCYLDLTIRQ